MSLLTSVVRKEVREVSRDGRLRLLGVIVVVLALAALAFGAAQTQRSQEARERARVAAQAQWQGQGAKNPHVAAHYGTHVFAPTSVATAVDPGVSAYLGRSVKIEAHKRNLAEHSSARDGGLRIGQFSVAAVLLLLVPLLIIALGYGTWSLERERGTLRQLLSTGVNRRTLMWGKAAALWLVIAALLIPAGLVIIGVLWGMGGGDAQTLIRLGLAGLAYGAYFGVFGGLTLYASAAARSSRGALVAMVGSWGLFCLIVPRVATEVAEVVRPLPSQSYVASQIEVQLLKGLDGETDPDKVIDARVKELMAKEGLVNTGFLVDDSYLTGFELQAEAEWEDHIYDHHVQALEDGIAAQEAAVAWSGLLSPYVAMRSVSAGLCGTDYAHHRHFTDRAELWRKEFVRQLNADFANNAGAKGWDYEADEKLWEKAPPFSYEAPTVGFALRTHWRSLLGLGLWWLLALVLAVLSARRARAV